MSSPARAKPKVAVFYTFPQTVVEDIGRLNKLSVTLSEAKGLVTMRFFAALRMTMRERAA